MRRLIIEVISKVTLRRLSSSSLPHLIDPALLARFGLKRAVFAAGTGAAATGKAVIFLPEKYTRAGSYYPLEDALFGTRLSCLQNVQERRERQWRRFGVQKTTRAGRQGGPRPPPMWLIRRTETGLMKVKSWVAMVFMRALSTGFKPHPTKIRQKKTQNFGSRESLFVGFSWFFPGVLWLVRSTHKLT